MGKNHVSYIVTTVIVAVVAAICAFFLIFLIVKAIPEAPPQEGNNGFKPSEEFSAEVKATAGELLSENYTIISLYVVKGLEVEKEPYGNKPEDGFYTVKDSKYKTFSDIEKIVDKVYVSKEADRIKTDANGYGQVYKDVDGKLELNMNFKPKDYEYSYGTLEFRVMILSEELCDIEISLKNKNDEKDIVKSTTQMKKEDGVWKLTDLVM